MDPLRNNGEQYAAKLAEAGVPVKVKRYEGVKHQFFGLSGLGGEAAEAVGLGSKKLRSAFGTTK